MSFFVPYWSRFKEIFSLDLRSLALFRVSFATLILFDLAGRAQGLLAHYTDLGVFPREVALRWYHEPFFLSLHFLDGSWEAQAVLFVIAAVFALMLLVGYKTRVATIASWLLLISLQTRNPLILQGGDIFMRATLFFAMFLPWGARYSVDCVRRSSSVSGERHASVWTAGFMIQVAAVYVFAGLVKTSVEWTREGSAIYYALSIDQFTRPFGYFLLQFPDLLRLLTFATLLFELFGPLLLFAPVFTRQLRFAAVAGFIAMHLGFMASMRLGPFPWIGIITMLALLPSFVWDFASRHARARQRAGLTIYYDGECGFCASLSRYLKTFLLLAPARLLVAATDERAAREMAEHNSWVVVDADGRRHFVFDGVVAVIRASPIIWFLAPMLTLPPVSALGEWLYVRVARRRRNICIPATLAAMAAERPRRSMVSAGSRAMSAACGLLFIGIVLAWNIDELPQASFSLPHAARDVAHLTRLDQRWAMFSPPLREDGWYVIVGTLEGGQSVDLLRGGAAVSYEKPRSVAAMYPTERWRKYLMNLYLGDFAIYRQHYGSYLCYTWNRAHQGAERVALIDIAFMSEMTLANYERAVPERKSLWIYDCRAPLGVASEVPTPNEEPSPSFDEPSDEPSPTTGVPLPYPTL
ncbi:MAG: HTTM domain-containing protein [bacterium]|nr:HTTM domain-containing protein [bacterium]MDZ4284418.1 HTTM domain-containing protein [Patescibacteria group bacterium]